MGNHKPRQNGFGLRNVQFFIAGLFVAGVIFIFLLSGRPTSTVTLPPSKRQNSHSNGNRTRAEVLVDQLMGAVEADKSVEMKQSPIPSQFERISESLRKAASIQVTKDTPVALALRLNQCLAKVNAVARSSTYAVTIQHKTLPGWIMLLPKAGSSTLRNNIAPSTQRVSVPGTVHFSRGWFLQSVGLQEPVDENNPLQLMPRALFVREPIARFISAFGTLIGSCTRKLDRWEREQEGLGFLCDGNKTVQTKAVQMVEDFAARGPRNEHMFGVGEWLGRFFPDEMEASGLFKAPRPLRLTFAGQIERLAEFYPFLEAVWGVPPMLADKSRPGAVSCEHCDAHSSVHEAAILSALRTAKPDVRAGWCTNMAVDLHCIGEQLYLGGSPTQRAICQPFNLTEQALRLGAGGDVKFGVGEHMWGRNLPGRQEIEKSL